MKYYTESESVSCSDVSDSLQPQGLYSPWNSPGQNTGVGNLSLLQGIFPNQWSNPGLPHCRRILYQLSHKGSLKYYIADKKECGRYMFVVEDLQVIDRGKKEDSI